MNGSVAVSFDADRTRAAFTFSHPKGNIITADMIAALSAGLESVAANPHLKLVTLAGAGPDFSFGASVPEHAADHIARVLPAMHALILDLLETPAVTAAVVRGRCLGGGFELALACDVIFAEESASFGLPEVALGVFAPAASVLLPLRVGSARATRALLTGAAANASVWRDAGLLKLVPPLTPIDAAVDAWFATHLAPRSAAALRHAVAAARHVLASEIHRSLPELERLYLDRLMHTRDAEEGIAAFMEKRAPRWSDS
jgi:cyclohexa-1,5-dienecarbonyl-CoA hydratase